MSERPVVLVVVPGLGQRPQVVGEAGAVVGHGAVAGLPLDRAGRGVFPGENVVAVL